MPASTTAPSTDNSRSLVLNELHGRRWSADDLFFAIACSDQLAVERILQAAPAAVMEQTDGGLTPISLAEWVGHADIERLVKRANRRIAAGWPQAA